MKRSVKKPQKSSPALIFRPGIYGLGKAVNPGDVSAVVVCDLTKFLIRPSISLELKIMLWIFPFPGIHISVTNSPNVMRPVFLPLGQAKLRSEHRGIIGRGRDLRLGAREEGGSSNAPLRVSLAPKAPFPFPFKYLPRRLVDDRCIIYAKTSHFNVITCVIEDLIEVRPVLSLFLEFSRVFFFNFQTFSRHQFRNSFSLLRKRANINED